MTQAATATENVRESMPLGAGGSMVGLSSHSDAVRSERNILLYLFGGMLLAAAWIGERVDIASEGVVSMVALLAALTLGAPLVWAALKEVKNRRVSSSSLAALAVGAAIVSQDFIAAGLLAFILLVAEAVLRRTAFGAQRAIEELVNLTPDTARRVNADGTEEMVGLSEIKVGDVIRIRPGENLPVDGVVLTGRTTINQASLTGEAVPAEAQDGTEVYAGTTNLTGNIDIRATLVGEETTIGKVSQLIREAEGMRTGRQEMIDQVARFFVPVAITVALVVWFVMSNSADQATKSRAVETAITVLVVSCPAALLLASPSAMVAAFASAARLGVLIKQTEHLEAAGMVDAVVMDKTGTITTGNFEVSKLVPAPGVEGADLLRAAVEGEQHSNHPLAHSIMRTGKAARIEPTQTQDFEEFHGRGVRAATPNGEVHVGRATWLRELNPAIEQDLANVESRIEGMTGVHVMQDGRYLGAVGLEDKVKAGTPQVFTQLRDLGVKSLMIFTGDRLSVATRVGKTVGADAIEAECLPEEKHEQIQQLVRNGYKTMMVGDGINDGPSLAAADVGVAMGAKGSDIATNSAGIALMTDELNRIPFLIELARKTRGIIAVNIGASIVIALIGLLLAATGILAVPAAALYHFAGEIFVMANSFRLFRFGEDFAAEEEAERRAAAERPQWTRREASVRNLQPASS